MWFGNIRAELYWDFEQIKSRVITAKSGTKQAQYTPANQADQRWKKKQLNFMAQICKI